MNGRWLVALLALGAGPAAASCDWEWLCNGDGTCKQMPVCDTVYEVPPPKPDSKPPVPPPLSMRPSKIAGNMRGLTCEHIMRQEKSGRWTWHEACFCSDSSKGKDASTPFSNIVRCETPWKEDKAAVPAAPGSGTTTTTTTTASAASRATASK